MWKTKFVRTHPASLMSVVLFYVVFQLVLMGAENSEPTSILMRGAAGLLLLAWIYAIYAVSRRARGKLLEMPRRSSIWPFAICALGNVVFNGISLLNALGYNAPLPRDVVGVFAGIDSFGFLLAIGFAAWALANAEPGDRPAAGRAIVLFLAILIFPIGAWFIHGRLKRIAEQAAAPIPPAEPSAAS